MLSQERSRRHSSADSFNVTNLTQFGANDFIVGGAAVKFAVIASDVDGLSAADFVVI